MEGNPTENIADAVNGTAFKSAIEKLFSEKNANVMSLLSELNDENEKLRKETEDAIARIEKNAKDELEKAKKSYDAKIESLNNDSKLTPEGRARRIKILDKVLAVKQTQIQKKSDEELQKQFDKFYHEILKLFKDVGKLDYDISNFGAEDIGSVAAVLKTQAKCGKVSNIIQQYYDCLSKQTEKLKDDADDASDASSIIEKLKEAFLGDANDSIDEYLKTVAKKTEKHKDNPKIKKIIDELEKSYNAWTNVVNAHIRGMARYDRWDDRIEKLAVRLWTAEQNAVDPQEKEKIKKQLNRLGIVIDNIQKLREQRLQKLNADSAKKLKTTKEKLFDTQNILASCETDAANLQESLKQTDSSPSKENDYILAVDKMVGNIRRRISSNNDKGAEEVKTARGRYDKKINEIIESDTFSGRAIKALAMGRAYAKQGKSRFGGIMDSLKGDTRRSFQNWAYGGSGLTGFAKAFIGSKIEGWLDKRRLNKFSANTEGFTDSLKKAKQEYLNTLNDPGTTQREKNIAKKKYLETAISYVKQVGEHESYGRSMLAEINKDRYGTNDEAQSMRSETSETFESLKSELKEVNKIIKAGSEPEPPEPKNYGIQQVAQPRRVPRIFQRPPHKEDPNGVIDIEYEVMDRSRPALNAPAKAIGYNPSPTIKNAGQAVIDMIAPHARGGRIARAGRAIRRAVANKWTNGGKKGITLNLKKENEPVLVDKGDVTILPSQGQGVSSAVNSIRKSGAIARGESAEDMEARQRVAEDQHQIAENTKVIVDLLQKILAAKTEKKQESFWSKVLGFLASIFGGLTSLLSNFGFLKKLLNLAKNPIQALKNLGGLVKSGLTKVLNLGKSAFSAAKASLQSKLGLKGGAPKTEIKIDAKGEPKAKGGKFGKVKELFGRTKDALKKFNPKAAVKGAGGLAKGLAKGLGKGLLAGVATELLIEGVTRGSASALGLTEEERQRAREERESMEVGYGRNDIYAGDLSDSEASDAEYEANKRTSEMWYRKRCEKLGLHHKTNQDSWFASSKDYRELSYDEIMALNPTEREFFNAWLFSKEGESKLAKLQREHPNVFGKAGKKPSNLDPATATELAIAKAKMDAMRQRAKSPSTAKATKEAQEAVRKIKQSNLVPAGLGIAGATAAGLAATRGLAGAGAAAGALGATKLAAGSAGGLAAAKMAAGGLAGGMAAGGSGAVKLALAAGAGLAGGGLGLGAAAPDSHHGPAGGGIFDRLKSAISSSTKKKSVEELVESIDISTKSIDKNVESIYKMVRFIKVDGVTLGDYLENKPNAVQAKLGAPGTPGTAQPANPSGPAIPGVPGTGGPGGFGGGGAGGPGGFGGGGKLGDTIARFESGNEGVMKIGYDKGGGTSYGKWQLSSKQGSYQEWLTLLGSGQYGEEGKRIAAKLKAAGPLNTGSRKGAAVDAYLQEAAAHKELFEESQRASYTKNQYNVAFKLLKSDSLKQQIQNDKAFQEMLFSTAVQHGQGGASSIFNAVYRDGMSRNELIEAVYRERTRRFGHTARRYAEEKEVIKGMSPTASPSTGGPSGSPAPSGSPSSEPVASPGGQAAPSVPGSTGGGLAGIVRGMGSFKYGMYKRGDSYDRYNKQLVRGQDGKWHAGSGAGFASLDCSQFASAVMANAGYGGYVNKNGEAYTAESIRQDLQKKHMPMRTDLNQVQEGDIAFTIGGKHSGSGRAGHVAVAMKDPQTGNMMIAESTGSSTSIGGGLKISPLKNWVDYYAKKKRVEIYQSPISGKQIDGSMTPMGGAPGGDSESPGLGIPGGGAGSSEGSPIPGAMGPGAGPQIQGSQQSLLADQASAFYAGGGAGGGSSSQTNILNNMNGNSNTQRPIISIKDPMSWVILQGNTVH